LGLLKKGRNFNDQLMYRKGLRELLFWNSKWLFQITLSIKKVSKRDVTEGSYCKQVTEEQFFWKIHMYEGVHICQKWYIEGQGFELQSRASLVKPCLITTAFPHG